MRISENMLLDGYQRQTCTLENISIVRGQRLIWSYRIYRRPHMVVVRERAKAHHISIDCDVIKVIPLAKRLTWLQYHQHRLIQRHKDRHSAAATK